MIDNQSKTHSKLTDTEMTNYLANCMCDIINESFGGGDSLEHIQHIAQRAVERYSNNCKEE